MHHDVEATCAANGYPLDARAFRPHITIARVREELGLDLDHARGVTRLRFRAAALPEELDGVAPSEL